MLLVLGWLVRGCGGLGASPTQNGCAEGAPFASFFEFSTCPQESITKKRFLKAFILLGGSYCTYSFVFRRKRVQVLHLLKFLPVVVHNFAAVRHVLR